VQSRRQVEGLLLDPEIERITRRNNSKIRKQNQ